MEGDIDLDPAGALPVSAIPTEPPHIRWLSIVGIGEDGVDGLSPAAARTIAESSLVIGGQRHLALAGSLITGDRLAWASPIEATFPTLLARRGVPTCVLATGDPFHYGIGATLAKRVPAAEIACHPQPSAFSLAAARLGWALQECACVSLHGRALAGIVLHLQPGARVLTLSWDGSTPAKLAALLVAHGYGASVMTVCEALGGPRERLRSTTADAFELAGIVDLNTVAVELCAAPGPWRRPLTPGLPIEVFEHDGQITKAAIRAVTLAALAPHPGETLWDVGAGSGSVSIEWLLAHPSLQAVAVEPRPERAARLRRNAERWGVADRLRVIEAAAPTALAGLPSPDAIFIGGGLTAEGMLDGCQAALSPGGRLVANAVTLESQARLSRALSSRGGDLMTVAVATAEPVGGFHGLRPAMAVMQWRWRKQ